MNKARASESGNLLLVDDEPKVLALFSAALSAAGYRTWQANNGRDALRLVRERRPDLVLLDVGLPDLSGIEVCRQIKADPALIDMFVVMVSGQAISSADKINGLGIGADDYLTKPVDLPELVARIGTWVRLHRTSSALRASEEHYRQLVEALPDAVGLLDLEGRVISLNPQAVKFFGHPSAHPARERSLFEYTLPVERDRIQADFARLRRSGTLQNVVYTIVPESGRPFPAELTAALWAGESGHPDGFVLVVRDMTERHQAREQISLLAQALRSIQEFVCITDDRNVIRYVNQASLEGFGYSEAELVGMGPEILRSRTNPAELGETIARATMRGGWKGELVGRRKDGSEFPVLLTTSQIRDNDGKIRGYVGVARDVSEVKRLERAVQEVSEREQRRFGELLHDGLCQRLFSTAMACNLLREKLTEAGREEALEAGGILSKLDDALGEARSLARGLSLSNLARDGLLAALRDLASETSRDSRVPCEIDCPESLCIENEALITHLYRIAREAVHNATKHARPRRIVVRLNVGMECGWLEIEDDGIGMAAPFGTGSGLGLEMMRSRARMIGSELEIRRPVSGGTTIACRFPVDIMKTLECRSQD